MHSDKHPPLLALCVILVDDDQLLVVRDLSFDKPSFKFVGGTQEPGESAKQTICREVHEEVGLTVADGHDFKFLGKTNAWSSKSLSHYEVHLFSIRFSSTHVYDHMHRHLVEDKLTPSCVALPNLQEMKSKWLYWHMVWFQKIVSVSFIEHLNT